MTSRASALEGVLGLSALGFWAEGFGDFGFRGLEFRVPLRIGVAGLRLGVENISHPAA